jgi:predicted nucleic acid-binding protein
MFLIDTNIFLEYILRRSRVQEGSDFFSHADLF